MKKLTPSSKADAKKTKQQLIMELNSLRIQLSRLSQTSADTNDAPTIEDQAEGLNPPEQLDKLTLLGKVFDLTTDAFIMVDERLHISYFNPGAEGIFGYSASETVGQSLNMLLPRVLRGNHNQHARDFAQGQESSRSMNERSSVMGQTKDGSVFPAKVTITKIEHNGQIMLAASLRDNSIYQEMEDLNRKIENELAHVSRVGMLSEISSSIAHELNQPLAAILANAQTLQRLNQALPMAIDGIDPIITDLIDDTRRASQVIKRLRELLKPGPSKLGKFDLNTTVTEVEQLLKSEFIIRQISLKLELAQDLPNVASDRIQLQQVLINLVANAFDAFDANDSDDPQITISTRQLNPIEAIVSVVDNGTGIEPKLVQKIFDPFYSSKIEGMGMGLSISQSLLQALGGKIWAENNSDGGASFHFTVELSNLDHEIEEIDEAGSKPSKGKLEAATVFIVDDDVSVLKAMKRLINSAGYEVETFSSSEEFLQRDEYPGVSCLLVDLHMPRLSGLDLQTQLNARDYTMPIIFITGAGNTATGVQAIKQGAMDFLTKPIDDEALLDIIASAAETDRNARAQFIRQKSTRENLSKLTPREREVLALVVKGLRNKQIAFELGISEKTVKAHRGRMMGKMEAKSIAGLVSVVESIIENPPQTR